MNEYVASQMLSVNSPSNREGTAAASSLSLSASRADWRGPGRWKRRADARPAERRTAAASSRPSPCRAGSLADSLGCRLTTEWYLGRRFGYCWDTLFGHC